MLKYGMMTHKPIRVRKPKVPAKARARKPVEQERKPPDPSPPTQVIVTIIPKFQVIAKEYSGSANANQRAYGSFARAAAEGLSKMQPGDTFDFGAWQEWARNELPQDSITRALVEDEDTKAMDPNTFNLKAEMIERTLKHEAELAAKRTPA